MEKKINDVIDYFKSKFLNLDFEITKIDVNSFKVLVDEKYEFIFLYSKEYNYIKVFECSFMKIELSGHEQSLMLEKLYPVIKVKLKEELIQEKQAELERLINELK